MSQKPGVSYFLLDSRIAFVCRTPDVRQCFLGCNSRTRYAPLVVHDDAAGHLAVQERIVGLVDLLDGPLLGEQIVEVSFPAM